MMIYLTKSPTLIYWSQMTQNQIHKIRLNIPNLSMEDVGAGITKVAVVVSNVICSIVKQALTPTPEEKKNLKGRTENLTKEEDITEWEEVDLRALSNINAIQNVPS